MLLWKPGKTVRNIRAVYLKGCTAKVENNRIVEYRTNVKVSFEAVAQMIIISLIRLIHTVISYIHSVNLPYCIDKLYLCNSLFYCGIRELISSCFCLVHPDSLFFNYITNIPRIICQPVTCRYKNSTKEQVYNENPCSHQDRHNTMIRVLVFNMPTRVSGEQQIVLSNYRVVRMDTYGVFVNFFLPDLLSFYRISLDQMKSDKSAEFFSPNRSGSSSSLTDILSFFLSYIRSYFREYHEDPRD
ncbi:MAG: dodecin domain-containing protein [Methanospirillaceae archaeon]|nr:dodecin domain-containing protein [Methanospirillaceae archaeon]